MKRKQRQFLSLICLIALLLSGCVIVHHGAEEGESGYRPPDSLGNRAYKSEEYAQEVWGSELLPYMRENATEIGTLLAALNEDADKARENYGSRAKGAMNGETFIVEGTATIVAVNTESSTGTLELDVDGDGTGDCAVQIGPVIKSTAIRDCAPFIRFDMFADQMEFAGVSRGFNKLVMSEVVGDSDFSDSVGRKLSFLGSFVDTNSAEGLMLIIPVMLEQT